MRFALVLEINLGGCLSALCFRLNFQQHVDPAAVAALEAMRSSGSSAVRAQQQGGPKGVLADYREHVKQQVRSGECPCCGPDTYVFGMVM